MLVSLGLDHRRAGLDVRERFHLEDEDVPRVHAALAAHGADESALTRTCNRVEVYTWWSGPGTEASHRERIQGICRAWAGDDAESVDLLRASAYRREGDDVVRHLFRVSSGLESQILGDIHILGQVRRSLRDAVEGQSIGTHLQRLFETALRVGKRVKRGTGLMATRRSVGSEAARVAAARWGEMKKRSCVVVGCGKSGTQAARMLRELGAVDLTVLNRSVHRAEQLAGELGAVRAAGLDALETEVARADIVIVATGAPEPIVSASGLRAARVRLPSAAPLLVIDVSVPRNVEPEVGSLLGVELIDLDTLRPGAAENERSRLGAVVEAENMVEESVEEFVQWTELRSARRALDPFHDVLSRICEREISYAVGEASPTASRTASRIVASVMAHPMIAARAASERGEPLSQALGALGQLFASPPDGGEGLFASPPDGGDS